MAAAGVDIILITINYRLFHLGFLASKDESIRGITNSVSFKTLGNHNE